MAVFTGTEAVIRVLGLGNEILGDDAFGILVAQEVRRRFSDEVEVVCSSAAGFDLLEDLLGVERLLVVDTMMTGAHPPGTMRVFRADEMEPMPDGSPHFVGLPELLSVAKGLGLALPREVMVIALEAVDCSTVGGALHPAVQSAIPRAVELIGEFIRNDPMEMEGG